MTLPILMLTDYEMKHSTLFARIVAWMNCAIGHRSDLTMTPKSFSHLHLLRGVSFNKYLCKGLFLPQLRILHFPILFVLGNTSILIWFNYFTDLCTFVVSSDLLTSLPIFVPISKSKSKVYLKLICTIYFVLLGHAWSSSPLSHLRRGEELYRTHY